MKSLKVKAMATLISVVTFLLASGAAYTVGK